MADDPPDYRRGAALQRAVDKYGTDTESEYRTHPALAAFHLALATVPATLAAAGAVGVLLTGGWVRWVLAVPTLLLAWPAAVAFAGFLYLLSRSGIVVLIYKDRLVWQRGSKSEVIRWDEVESLHVHTVRDTYQVNYEPPASAYRVYLETPPPTVRYWRGWLEVRTKDGRVVRVPSSITDYEDLSQVVQQEVFGVLGPPARARIDAGRSARFGPLTLRADRLEHGGEAVAWDEHEDTGPYDGRVKTTDKAGEQVGPAIPVEDVPNLGLAMSLATDLSASQAASIHHRDEDEDEDDD